MLNGQRQVIKSFIKVAILLLLSVFLMMTIDISEGIIGKFGKWIKKRVYDACNFGCQTDYISCHINLKTGYGSKRELCWEKCKKQDAETECKESTGVHEANCGHQIAGICWIEIK